ncbi:MAG: RidA family protein [Bacillota bacterium]
MKSVVYAPEAPAALGPYSHAIESNGFVFTSGQIGINPATGELEGSVEEQTRQALHNLKVVLAAVGCAFSSIVKTTVFVQDLNDFATVNAIYGEAFGGEFPARSCVQVAKLPAGALVEIEAVAAK